MTSDDIIFVILSIPIIVYDFFERMIKELKRGLKK